MYRHWKYHVILKIYKKIPNFQKNKYTGGPVLNSSGAIVDAQEKRQSRL